MKQPIYDICNRCHIFSQGGKPSTSAKKSISVAIKIMNALDTDVVVFGQYWKHAQFTVESRPYEGDNK